MTSLLQAANSAQRRKIIESFVKDLESFTATTSDGSDSLRAVCCATCDSMPKKANDWSWVDVDKFKKYATNCRLQKSTVSSYYPSDLVDFYTSTHPELSDFILSPSSLIDTQKNTIAICEECLGHLEQHAKKNSQPPVHSIVNGNLVGSAPTVLKELSEVELSLISQVRITCHTFVFYGGVHRSIQGWHTLFKNRPSENIANISLVTEAGLRGQIVVVLCGPFTTTQKALALAKTTVRPEKVIRAFEWLKENNLFYKDIIIPEAEDLPKPFVIEEKVELTDSRDVNIENHINLTVVFPDSELPEKTTGGFRTQEEFRKYVHEHQKDASWNSEFHVRPQNERLADYHGRNVAQAFPLNFPFGHSGLPDDPAVVAISGLPRKKGQMKRTNANVLKRLLQHSNPDFHRSLFVLIVANIIMKETIFSSCRLSCNSTRSNGDALAIAIAKMTSDELQTAIQQNRMNSQSRYNNWSRPATQYLHTIEASCRSLPHTNEASLEARKVYFSYLMRYGNPTVFLTVTPDDQRSFRIVVYSAAKVEKQWGSIDTNRLSDSDILADFKIRQQTRTEFPGLCAEEYRRIMDLVIKHIFQWDEDKQESTGVGLFGELVAWCAATEEQGRKTLHGHFLLFVKDWPTFVEQLQTAPNVHLTSQMTNYFDSVCSAKMFQDFAPPTGTLNTVSLFDHDCQGLEEGTGTRHRKVRRITPKPIAGQILREMRHKKLCQHHKGKVSTCPICQHTFTIPDIMSRALKHHFHHTIEFPKKMERLDRHVYELQKDFCWFRNPSNEQIDLRLFAANSLVNLHSITHASRCFKGGKKECYASLPEQSFDKTILDFEQLPDVWYDAVGKETERYMFRIYPKRSSADAFVNSHNQVLTYLLLCNTNVMCGMTGAAVYYVTGYNAKMNQKEEKEAYETIQATVVKALKRREENLTTADDETDPEFVTGLKRTLAGVIAHTNAHILAAPMAHYITLYGSRFRRSHDHSFLPSFGLDSMLRGDNMTMTFKTIGGEQKATHRCMDYIYRPVDFEDMSAYEFYSSIKVDYKNKLDKDQESFDLSDGHPMQNAKLAVYRDKEAVPVFGWSWLPRTDGLGSLLEEVSTNHVLWEQRELYCRKFLILFYPYRTNEDLLAGQYPNHQEKFRQVIPFIPKDLIEVANNIQNISNSLNSSMPGNLLLEGTELEEEISKDRRNQENDTDQNDYSEMFANIGNYLNSVGADSQMQEEATAFTPKFAAYSNAGQVVQSPGEAFEIAGADIVPPNVIDDPQPRQYRWKTTTNELNSLLMTNLSGTQINSSVNVNGSAESIIDFGKSYGLDPNQQLAFQILAATYVLTFFEEATTDNVHSFIRVEQEIPKLKQLARPNDPESKDPLRLFVTGPAGAGKSAILSTMMAYCRQFSRNIGHIFDNRTTIVMSSMTGSSAISIGGDTAAKTFGLRYTSDEADAEEKLALVDTRMCIIDEVSFMDYHLDLEKLSHRLQSLTEYPMQPFGKMHLAFLGDFHQLEPVGGNTIYNHKHSLFWESSLNCMVELNGVHRFRDCPVFSKIMPELRNGIISEDTRKLLNSRVVDGDRVKIPTEGRLKYATHYNKPRSQLNASVFKDYLIKNHSKTTDDAIPKTAIVIKAGTSWACNKKKLSPAQRKVLFQECDESIIKDSNRKHADPFLCLFTGCEVMVNANLEVRNGIANGTTATFRKAILKKDAEPTPIQVHGYWVYAVDIQDVDHLELEWRDCDPYFTGTFKVHAQQGTFRTFYPIYEMGSKTTVAVKLALTYFPVLLNTATTCHKLQGKSVDSLIIAEWHNTVNWAYVVLSRVRTLDGLYLLKKLPRKIDFKVNEKCVAMEDRLRKTILVTPPSN